VACGGGAGLAAVYNVPLGGAIFTAEVLLGSFALPTVLPGLGVLAHCDDGRVAVSAQRCDVRGHPGVPLQRVADGVVGAGGHRDRALGRVLRAPHWLGVARSCEGCVNLLGDAARISCRRVIGIWYPQLFGNGKDMAHEAFLGVGGIGLLFALFALKPFVHALTLGSGAAGGSSRHSQYPERFSGRSSDPSGFICGREHRLGRLR